MWAAADHSRGTRILVAVDAAAPHDLDQLSPTADASAKALPAACVVCANDDPGVSEFQRCDGGCDRWFCIGGSCARDLGVMNYTRDMSGGDLVCGDCAEEAASVQKKLKTSSASITTALEQQEFREQGTRARR